MKVEIKGKRRLCRCNHNRASERASGGTGANAELVCNRASRKKRVAAGAIERERERESE